MSTSATIGVIVSTSAGDRVTWSYCHTDGGSVQADLEWLFMSTTRSAEVPSAVAAARDAVAVAAPWPTPFAFMVDARAAVVVEVASLRLEDRRARGRVVGTGAGDDLLASRRRAPVVPGGRVAQQMAPLA